MDRTDQFVENLLSPSEKLVYDYIRMVCEEQGGSFKESMSDIANNIFELYNDQIEARKVKKKAVNEKGKHYKDESGKWVLELDEQGNPIEVEDKSFSEATVHRAIKALLKEGIITVIPSKEKAEPNEIVFHGAPDEEQQINDILSVIDTLTTYKDRFASVVSKKDHENDKLKRQLETADEHVAELMAEVEALKQLCAQKDEMIRQLQGGDMVFDPEKIISKTSVGNGLVTVIMKE